MLLAHNMPLDNATLDLIDAAGAVAARLALAPTGPDASDAIETFEAAATQFRIDHGNQAADDLLARIAAAGLIHQCA